MKVKVKVQTDLLKGEAWNSAIKKAQDKIKPRSLAQLRSLTPVLTGTMQRTWSIENSRLNLLIKNPQTYSSYIDQGTKFYKARNITENSLPGIVQDYENAILAEIDNIR